MRFAGCRLKLTFVCRVASLITTSKQKISGLTTKLKEQKRALEFVLSSLDEREMEVAELRVAVDLQRERCVLLHCHCHCHCHCHPRAIVIMSGRIL